MCIRDRAGINSDANILINSARLSAQRYLMTYQEPVPMEQLVQTLCDQKQGYTQYGGLRPFGVSFLFGGWDKNCGFQLYQSDPSGNYAGWMAAAIGANATAAQAILKTEYKEGMTLEDARRLAHELPGLDRRLAHDQQPQRRLHGVRTHALLVRAVGEFFQRRRGERVVVRRRRRPRRGRFLQEVAHWLVLASVSCGLCCAGAAALVARRPQLAAVDLCCGFWLFLRRLLAVRGPN